MPITDILERNCKLYGNDICLVEINPEIKETRRVTWKEYELMEPNPVTHYRREITWSVFNEKANRFANLLLERGIKKGKKEGKKAERLGIIGRMKKEGLEEALIIRLTGCTKEEYATAPGI